MYISSLGFSTTIGMMLFTFNQMKFHNSSVNNIEYMQNSRTFYLITKLSVIPTY